MSYTNQQFEAAILSAYNLSGRKGTVEKILIKGQIATVVVRCPNSVGIVRYADARNGKVSFAGVEVPLH